MLFTKKRVPQQQACRFVTEEMILREGIANAKTLRRGMSTFVGPVSRNSIASMKLELPETKYEYELKPIQGHTNLFDVVIRRRRMFEERKAKKTSAPVYACRIRTSDDIIGTGW